LPKEAAMESAEWSDEWLVSFVPVDAAQYAFVDLL
jgi:hypothetical protein